jgi:hypothetical protein
MQEAAVETEPEARPVLDHPAREPREAALDRLDRVGGREQLLDVGLAQVEGHQGPILSTGLV